MRWSVGIEAGGDLVLTREQVVELAAAVAPGGIATGIGTNRYGAKLVVEAGRGKARFGVPTARARAAHAQATPAARVIERGPADRRART